MIRAFALLLALAPAVAEARCAAGDPRLAGLYELRGEMEMGSMIALRPDGQFEFMLAYGALDQYGKGCWSVEGNTLTLLKEGRRRVPARPGERRFEGAILQIDRDGDLLWPQAGLRGRYVKVRH